MEYFGKSDVGRKRSKNEDAFVLQPLWDDNHLLAVVIDGVGGSILGKLAADLSRMQLIEYLQERPEGDLMEALNSAVLNANNYVYAYAAGDGACVLTAAVIDCAENKIYVCHVGDTRLYSYADGKLSKLTRDHSVVGPLEEDGTLTEEEAMQHPRRNLITRSVGRDKVYEPERFLFSQVYPFTSPVTFLLCSDGLYDMVRSVEISEVLARPCSAQDKVEPLISMANEAGGKDNVTVLVVEVK